MGTINWQHSVFALAMVTAPVAMAETLLTMTYHRPGKPSVIRHYNLQQLREVGLNSVATKNDFIDEKALFEGPLMRDLIKDVGAESARTAQLRAANDYSVEIETSEFQKYDVILAVTKNGTQLTLRDKGPIWVIYPMTEHLELRHPSFNSRLIWQLTSVILR